ncbi:MAG: hypothetical protein Q9165_002759 [Trypethelium subeluteriae]
MPHLSRQARLLARNYVQPNGFQAKSSSTTFQCARSFSVSRPTLEDVAITRTGKPIIKIAGLHSEVRRQIPLNKTKLIRAPGHTATVFGATGFLGRYIVNRLGMKLLIDCVKVALAEVIGIQHVQDEYDLRNTASIEESVRHSDMVYNLVGRDYPTKNFDLEDVHVEGTHRIAEACAKYDIDRFVQVSSFNADKNSPSEFFRTKARGEEVARNVFPETTIVRPAPMFGFEDRLLNKLASASNLFTSNHMEERYWPVHVIDVGMALETMIDDDGTASQTYELHGPTEYSTAEIAEFVDKEIIKHRRHFNVPKAIMKPVAQALNRGIWWMQTSADQVEREFIDQKIDKTAKTFADLGIEPAELPSLTFDYLKGYRSSAYYDLPPQTERERREEKRYLHVIDDQ